MKSETRPLCTWDGLPTWTPSFSNHQRLSVGDCERQCGGAILSILPCHFLLHTTHLERTWPGPLPASSTPQGHFQIGFPGQQRPAGELPLHCFTSSPVGYFSPLGRGSGWRGCWYMQGRDQTCLHLGLFHPQHLPCLKVQPGTMWFIQRLGQ